MSEWIESFRAPHGETILEHLDGISWHDAPIPPKNHKCVAQTRGWMHYFTYIERCACGSIRHDNDRHWLEKNSRRPLEVEIEEHFELPAPVVERFKSPQERIAYIVFTICVVIFVCALAFL